MSEYRERVLIIGSGAAGLTAAIYTARANIDPLLVKGLQPGGQMTITTDVENYPGFADVIQGPWLMEQMEAQARQVGTRMVEDIITSIDTSQRPFHLKGDTGDDYYADAVIVATGAQARWLGLESEARLNGKGVSACATCDGFFFRGQEVAVVGGGNTAVEEALFLTKFASKVILIHRRNTLRAEKVLQKRLFANKKIEILWDNVVTEIVGTKNPKKVNSILLRNTKNNSSKQIAVDGIFIAIGHKPNTNVFLNKLDLDNEGYIKTNNLIFTNIPGVFAAGDVHDKTYRQAVTAAGYGCMAALEAEKFLTSIEN